MDRTASDKGGVVRFKQRSAAAYPAGRRQGRRPEADGCRCPGASKRGHGHTGRQKAVYKNFVKCNYFNNFVVFNLYFFTFLLKLIFYRNI